MTSQKWLIVNLALLIALVASILLLPPWSPLSITSPKVPETTTPAEPPANPEAGQTALATFRSYGSEGEPTLPQRTEAAPVGAQKAAPESPKESAEAPTSQGSDDVLELIQATEHPDWQVRWDAVDALGGLKDPRGIPALVQRALSDENPHPRWRSLWALAAVDRNGQEALPLLRASLQNPDPVVGRNAAVALAFFDQPEARPYLLQGLKDPDPFRRWEAVFSLGQVGDPEVAKALIPLLDARVEPDLGVRGEVALALGRMGSKEALAALLQALRQDSSPEVRWRAAMALPNLGDASAVGELEQALLTEKDSTVQQNLQEAIAQLRQHQK